MALNVFNTLTRQKEPFQPLEPGRVGMYVCGPTVYDHAHIGHARTYIAFDVIARYLEYIGNKVFYVQNITDVGHLTDVESGEDKIQKKAAKERLVPMEIVETYMRGYFRDMDSLGVRRPNVSPRAAGHIIEIIELVKTLIGKGYAYEANGSVYFDISKAENYGKLSGRKFEELVAGARVEVNSEKRNPGDFALWKKASPEHIMKWPSQWGLGFPGWHIECSAMSTKYLGPTFDIHGGAMDLIFPHHENEILQSEGATGKPFVRYWLHTGFLNVGGEKMSKSLGNFITIDAMLKKVDPEVFRFFILSTHYRSPIDYSEQNLEQAKSSLGRLKTTIGRLEGEFAATTTTTTESAVAVTAAKTCEQKFCEAMDDDFNTPLALAALFDLAHEGNKLMDSGKLSPAEAIAILSTFRKLGGILGVLQQPQKKETGHDLTKELVDVIAKLRAQAREKKDFAASDLIRSEMSKIGIVLEDQSDGTVRWKLSS